MQPHTTAVCQSEHDNQHVTHPARNLINTKRHRHPEQSQQDLSCRAASSVQLHPLQAMKYICKPELTGIFSISLRLMPIVMVVMLLGQDPQAPCSLSCTMGPSMSCSATFPPSEIRYGRICRNTRWESSECFGADAQGRYSMPQSLCSE